MSDDKTEQDLLVGRYRLDDTLGVGGQGRTHRGFDTRTGQAVAIKCLELREVDGWKAFDLFEREGQVLKSLSHPGIPRYLDTFSDEASGRFYLVMELVEGATLEQRRREHGTMSEADLWDLLDQALDILEYLHARKPPVVHRDVKPANLIWRPDGKLALVDFGGVRCALRPDGGSTMVGTFGYMAPEQLHGEATAATDLFALAATLVALATGLEADKLPRRGLKIDLERVMAPSALRDLLSRMLEPDPERRLGSVRAVREAVEDAGVLGPPLPDYDYEVPEPVRLLASWRRSYPLIGAALSIALWVIATTLQAMLWIGGHVALPAGFAAARRKALRRGRHREALTLEAKERRAIAALEEGRKKLAALARGQDPAQVLGELEDRQRERRARALERHRRRHPRGLPHGPHRRR